MLKKIPGGGGGGCRQKIFLTLNKYWKVPLHLLVKWEVVSPNRRYGGSGNLYPIYPLVKWNVVFPDSRDRGNLYPMHIQKLWCWLLNLLAGDLGWPSCLVLTEGDSEGHSVLCIYINFHLLCYCIDRIWKISGRKTDYLTRQSEMADLARRATRDLSQFHMGVRTSAPFDLGNYNA